MSKTYLPYEPDQQLLMPAALQEWRSSETTLVSGRRRRYILRLLLSGQRTSGFGGDAVGVAA